MSIITGTVFLFGLMIALLVLGLPIAFALGGSAVIFGFIIMGPTSIPIMVTSILNNMRTIVLIALPLFIFMGSILQVSGIAESAYSMVHKWLSSLGGGLAIGTV